MGFISANTIWQSLLYNIVYLYSGAFLCLFTVRERLRKSWLFIVATVVVTSVPYVLISGYFYYFTIVYAALAFVFCLWVADVPLYKMLFVFLLAANYLYLASALVRQVGDGNQHLLVLLNIPLVAWWMRRSIWPLVRDMEPPELKIMFPLAVVLFAAAMFVCSDYFLVRMGIPIHWRMAIVFVVSGITFLAYMVMLRMLRSMVQNARLREEMNLAQARVAAETAALEQVNRMKTEFLGNIAHELRTPLAVVSSHAQLVLEHEKERAASNEYIVHKMRLTVAEVERMAQMTQQLSDVARMEEGHFALQCAAVDIGGLVRKTVETFYPLLSKNGNTLAVELPGETGHAFCDAGRVRQALLNIVNNAVRYTQNGTITVSARQQDGFIAIAVQDTGSGIAPARLARIFERYYSEEPNPKAEATGTGLGLFITKQIVEAHGGGITIESEAGSGTEVCFTLPVAQEENMDGK